MPTIAGFAANPLFARFTEPKYPAAIVEAFLSIAATELEEHRSCMGSQFNLIAFLLTAHRLSRWSSAGLLVDEAATSVGVMSVSEMRQVVTSLSVTDEGGSESITFQQNNPNPSLDSSAENFLSTEFGVLYLSLFKKSRCVRSWSVL